MDQVRIIFGAPLLLLYALSRKRKVIAEDASRWIQQLELPFGRLRSMAFMLGHLPEFRSLLYYRVEKFWRPAIWILQIFYPPCPALYLYTRDIGPGLFIQHGFATAVGAHRIGKNCWINQQVTIGWGHGGAPVIGDNVRIYSGAHVIGPITIGDNVVVGAGTVVLNDIPSNCTVFGVPGRVVKRGVI